MMKTFYENQCLSVITWKKVVQITYTLEKRIFVAATFEGLCIVSSVFHMYIFSLMWHSVNSI